MSSHIHTMVEHVQSMIKPVGLSGKHGMIAAALVAGLVFLNFLRKYISVLRVSPHVRREQKLMKQQVSGLHVIHSAVELFEAGHRSKLPNIPFLAPTNALTIDDPWKSEST